MSECKQLTGSCLERSLTGYRENHLVPDLVWKGALARWYHPSNRLYNTDLHLVSKHSPIKKLSEGDVAERVVVR